MVYAYNVFEVLNARGLPLTDFELLRNYLLRYTDNRKKIKVKEQIVHLEELLGNDAGMFLKHYAKHKYGVKTDKRINSLSEQNKIKIKGARKIIPGAFLRDMRG